MISFFRSIFSTKLGGFLALAFVLLIGLAFALGDLGSSFSGGGIGSTNVARVGGTDVPSTDITTTIRNGLNQETQNNPDMDMKKYIEGGAFDDILTSVIGTYAMKEFGDKYDIGVSKRLVDSEINNIPQVKGLDGEFNADAFQAFLRNISLTEKNYRLRTSQTLSARQTMSIANKGVKVPKSLASIYASLELEKREGQFAVISSLDFKPKEKATEAQVAKYYKDNIDKFKIPETRAVTYAIFDKELVAETSKPTQEEIASYYKDNADAYQASETRNFEKIVVLTQAAAQALADKVNAGETMAAAAQSAGLSVTSESDFTKTALANSVSADFADKVFSADKGKITSPANGGGQWHIAKVSNITSIPAKSLEQATAEITQLLEVDKSQNLLAELTTEIDEEVSRGSSVADIAKAQDLKIVTTPELFVNGSSIEDPSYKPEPVMQVILPVAYELLPEGNGRLIELVPGESYAIVGLAAFNEAAAIPFKQVKQDSKKYENLSQLWAISEGAKEAKAISDKIIKEVNAGKSLKKATDDAGVKITQFRDIKASRKELQNQQENRLPVYMSMLFELGEGRAKSFTTPNDKEYLIVSTTKIITQDASKDKDLVTKYIDLLGNSISSEYSSQLVNAAMNDVGVERNDDAIVELRKQLIDNSAR